MGLTTVSKNRSKAVSKTSARRKRKRASGAAGITGEAGKAVGNFSTALKKYGIPAVIAVAATGAAVALVEPKKDAQGQWHYDFKLPAVAAAVAWLPTEYIVAGRMGITKEMARGAGALAAIVASMYETVILPAIARDPEGFLAKLFKWGYDLLAGENKDRAMQQMAMLQQTGQTSAGSIFNTQGGVSFDQTGSFAASAPAPVSAPVQQPKQDQTAATIGAIGGAIGGIANAVAAGLKAFGGVNDSAGAAEDTF